VNEAGRATERSRHGVGDSWRRLDGRIGRRKGNFLYRQKVQIYPYPSISAMSCLLLVEGRLSDWEDNVLGGGDCGLFSFLSTLRN